MTEKRRKTPSNQHPASESMTRSPNKAYEAARELERNQFTTRVVKRSGVKKRRASMKHVALCLLLVLLTVLSIALTLLTGVHGQDVFTVKIRVVDANGAGVPNALINMSGYGAASTGADGYAVFQLPKGTVNVTVTFINAKVGEATLDVQDDGSYTITVTVFSLHVVVLDLQSQPSAGVLVKAQINGETQSQVTNDSGLAFFEQLPATAVRLKAYADGALIGEADVVLTRNSEVTIRRENFYKQTFRVKDLEDLPAPNVDVQVAGVENTTDLAGVAEVYLKSGVHKVSFILYGLRAYETSITVTRDASYNATIKASTLQATLLDESNSPYIGTAILRVGEVNLTADTDAAGTLKVKQIPHGKMSVSTAVGVATNFSFTGDPLELPIVTRELRISASILSAYMLGAMKVKATVYIGEQPMKAATVTFYASTGTYSKKTGSSGYAIFDIPMGLEGTAKVTVEASGYGQKKTVILTSEASPLVPLAFPFAFAPLIAFIILSAIYKRQQKNLSLLLKGV